jgi:hypothetical protein
LAIAQQLSAEATASPARVAMYHTEEFDNAFIQAVSVQIELLNKGCAEGETLATVFLSCAASGSTGAFDWWCAHVL